MGTDQLIHTTVAYVLSMLSVINFSDAAYQVLVKSNHLRQTNSVPWGRGGGVKCVGGWGRDVCVCVRVYVCACACVLARVCECVYLHTVQINTTTK